MNRLKWNAFIDTLAFIALVAMTSTGLVLRFMLPPGSGRLEAGGPGLGTGRRSITVLWGMTRHQWGDVHFWAAVVLLAILSIHLALHWRWIVCMVKGEPQQYSGVRIALAVGSLVALMILALSPFFSSTEIVPRGR